MADAIRVLTEVARLTRPVLSGTADNSPGRGTRVEPIDWAEFVTLALAGVAANVGRVEAVLAGRPGSWEADGVRSLLTSSVGHDEQYLLQHRTEPVVVQVFVDEILNDLGVWARYDQVDQAPVDRASKVDPTAPDQEDQLDAIAEQEERLEQERQHAWAAYGEALRVRIQAGAAGRPGLTVPVRVDVDLDTLRTASDLDEAWGIAQQLLNEAVGAVPVAEVPQPEVSENE